MNAEAGTGDPRADLGDPDPSAPRPSVLLFGAGAVLLLVLAGLLAWLFAGGSSGLSGSRSGEARATGTAGYVIGPVDCSKRPDSVPSGTDLVEFGVVSTSTDQVVLRALFDGTVPAPVASPQEGDITLALSFYLYENSSDSDPYRLFVSTLFDGTAYHVQVGRADSGFIDSSGFDVSVTGDQVMVSFDPSVLTELDPTRAFPIAADTLAQLFESTSSSLGYTTIGEEVCPPQ